jgi:UDP-N-acetylglucosamine:LPS N-acetylglucosamine transferase
VAIAGKTVLFAWELGEGLGHLPPLKAIALALKARGANVVFALRDAVLTRAALADVGAPILPAPFWPTPQPPPTMTGTYADILAGNGFGEGQHVKALVEAWGEIFDAVRPDLIVGEHSPGASLAAFGRIPVAVVGNGFVVPPADGPEFPPFDAKRGAAGSQRPVLAAIQEAMSALKREAPRTLTEAFRGAFRGIYTFPPLDTYRGVRREAVLGPVDPIPPLSPLPVKGRLFAYSAADYALANQVTQALMDVGPDASAYFRGSLGAKSAMLASRGVQVYETAPDLALVLKGAGVVFSHGGTGVTHAALGAGRPHIVNPRHFEARSTARALEALGAGISLDPFDPTAFREAVLRANDDGAMRRAAQKAGAEAHDFVQKAQALEKTVAALDQLLG